MAILEWPGKSALEPGGVEHPAAYHMIDVASVAELLLDIKELDLRHAVILLTALHDLGKFNAEFRKMIRGEAYRPTSHWQATEVVLRHHDAAMAKSLRGGARIRAMLHAATAGHHGRPPIDDGQRFLLVNLGAEALADAGALIAAFAALWPGGSLEPVSHHQARQLSWWLPGFVSTCDWVGSNPAWFPATAPDMSLNAYQTLARQRAVVAVEAAGLNHPKPGDAPLFDFALRPMQSACDTIPLPEGPMLAVIEDETGSGKTEAALLLAHRMLRAGKGRGLYFALPTMATSDAMFRRARRDIGKMFVSSPTLTLAHGRAGLSAEFRDIIEGRVNAPEDPGCTDWLAESRRRALLATVGVGTIDQALLAALPTRFHTLRHYALSSKILIVDEVHELGESYIETVLEQLLALHKQAGGSAILLTATLPLAQRSRLMAIYGDAQDDPAYPAVSIAAGAARRDLPQATGPRGEVGVERLAHVSEVVDLLESQVATGAACVWVRNAVDDAIASVDLLRARGIAADLLHARFALADRKRIEADMLTFFGKDRTARPGRVLVGTQVLESSLDLDFDVMVSDLAPMASLIQRAGRLWRHMDLRPASTRPVSGPSLHVLAPDPGQVTNDRWLHDTLGQGAFVYPLDDQFRTARAIFSAGKIVAPSGLRALIEAVHGDTVDPVPQVLEQAEIDRMGKQASARNLAWQNVIDLGVDFRRGSGGEDDAQYPTRLGQPVQTLALARVVGGVCLPWADNWPLSEVTASVARLKGRLPDQDSAMIRAAKADWPEWKRAAVTICPVGERGEMGEGLAYDPERGLIFD